MDITIKIERFRPEFYPYDPTYIAHIEGELFKGTVVESDSLQGCLMELKKSLDVLEKFEKKKRF